MDNIYIEAKEIPQCLVDEYFTNEDLITLEDIINAFDDLYYEFNSLKDDYENFKQDVQDNYKPISQREQIGYDERTW